MDILGYANLSINPHNEIDSIAYTMIDSKTGEKVLSGLSNKHVASGNNPHFVKTMKMLRDQNVFSYTINRIIYPTGYGTIHMIHHRYTVNGGDFYNIYLYEGVQNENPVVS